MPPTILDSVIRVPTEQFAYIEVKFTGTEEEIIAKYREITDLYHNHYNGKDGLIPKDWNIVLDKYLASGHLAEEEYGKMSIFQQALIQEIKKSFKRSTDKI